MKYENMQEDRKLYGASWAREKDLRRTLTQESIRSGAYSAGGIPVITDGDELYQDCTDSHNLIFGTTGSKKTRIFAMPLIMSLIRARESFLVTDPKGELYDRTGGFLAEYGYTPVILDFRNVESGDGWNPLYWPYELTKNGEKAMAEEIFADIIALMRTGVQSEKDRFWENLASNSIQGLMSYLVREGAPEQQNFYSIVDMNDRLMNDAKLAAALVEAERDPILKIKLRGYTVEAQNTKASQRIVIETMLGMVGNHRDLMQKLSVPSNIFRKMAQKQVAIYLILPDENTTYHFVASMFMKQFYLFLIQEAQKQENHSLPIRMNFVLDEFANMPRIPGMASMISAARSRNIRFHLFVQSLHQLKERYEKEWNTIVGNCNNLFFLASRERELLEMIEFLCGKVSYEREGEHPLITSFELQHLSKEKGEALALIGRNLPYVTRLYDIDEYGFEKRGQPQLSAGTIPAAEDIRIFNIATHYRVHRPAQRSRFNRDEEDGEE